MKERGAAMIPTEDIMPIVKNTIAASIKCNTHRGYIGWSSCDNICMDMHDCLDMCAETLEMRAYLVALEATTYILIGRLFKVWCSRHSVNVFCISSSCRYRALTVCTRGYIVSFLPTTQMRL